MTRFTLLAMCVAAAAESPAAERPSDILDLNGWKLTLPYDTSRKGNPDEVVQPALKAFQDPSSFYVSNASDAVVFRASCGALGTKNSEYPRSELREMGSDGQDEIAWATDDRIRHVMEIELAIQQTPEVKRHVVCAQVHARKDDVMMVRLEGKKLFIERNETGDVKLDSDYQLGDKFAIRIETGDGRIRVWYNNALKMDWRVSKKKCYFKAGCYTQSNVKKGDRPDAFGEVAIYRLRVTHGKGP